MRLFLTLLFFLPAFQPNATAFLQAGQTKTSEEVQPVPLAFDQEKLQAMKADPAYDYAEAALEENWWMSFKRYLGTQWQRLMDWLFGGYKMPFLFAVLVDILPYLIIGALIGLILYLFSRFAPIPKRSKPKNSAVFYDEEEKIIRSKDIPRLIDAAVKEGRFRLAVRYHFLFVLQQLSRKEIITYDNSKTDEEYLSEISNDDLRQLFARLNYLYDFVWYGEFDTTGEDYRRIKKEFQKMDIRLH